MREEGILDGGVLLAISPSFGMGVGSWFTAYLQGSILLQTTLFQEAKDLVSTVLLRGSVI